MADNGLDAIAHEQADRISELFEEWGSYTFQHVVTVCSLVIADCMDMGTTGTKMRSKPRAATAGQ